MTTQPTAAQTEQSAPSTPVELCVAIVRTQPSVERGHSVQWTVSAWTTGGDAADAALQLRATPASGGAPGFSFGCGNDNGTSICDLGAVDANSAQRQLQAQLTVPVTASSVKSVTLAVVGTTANLVKDPEATTTVAITASPATTGATAPPATAVRQPPTTGQGSAPAGQAPTASSHDQAPLVSTVVTSPLPVASLPSIPAANPTLSPSGNAAGLFPTLDPKPTVSAVRPTGTARTRAVADTSALPQGASVIGAQLAGLAALAAAFVLAMARLSLRRRPASQQTPDPAAPSTEGVATENGEEGATTPLPAQDA